MAIFILVFSHNITSCSLFLRYNESIRLERIIIDQRIDTLEIKHKDNERPITDKGKTNKNKENAQLIYTHNTALE